LIFLLNNKENDIKGENVNAITIPQTIVQHLTTFTFIKKIINKQTNKEKFKISAKINQSCCSTN